MKEGEETGKHYVGWSKKIRKKNKGGSEKGKGNEG